MTTDNPCPMTDAAADAKVLRVDVCPECGGSQQYSGALNFPCRHEWHYREWHDQPVSATPSRFRTESAGEIAHEYGRNTAVVLRDDVDELLRELAEAKKPKTTALGYKLVHPQFWKQNMELIDQLKGELAGAKRLYEMAVKGRQEFRSAFREAKERAESAEARAAELQGKLEAAAKQEPIGHVPKDHLPILAKQSPAKIFPNAWPDGLPVYLHPTIDGLAAETARAHNAAIDKVQAHIYLTLGQLETLDSLKVPK